MRTIHSLKGATLDRRKRREAQGADTMISLFRLVAGSVRPPVVVVLMTAAILPLIITNAGSTLLRFAVGQVINREIAPISGLVVLNPQGVNGISPPNNPASILSGSLPLSSAWGSSCVCASRPASRSGCRTS